MSDDGRSILSEAIARGRAALLALPSAGLLRQHKSRFLTRSERGIWIASDAAADDAALVRQLVASGHPITVSFEHDGRRVDFTSALLGVDPRFALNDEMRTEALLVALPERVQAVQRRSNYRVRIFQDSDVAVRVWRVAENVPLSKPPLAAQELSAQLTDVSIGGIGVVLTGRDGQSPKVCPEDRLRIEFRHGRYVMLLEGRLRGGQGPQAPGTLRTGIQFATMDDTLDGRQKLVHLTRLVGELQRDEIRRMRLGLAS